MVKYTAGLYKHCYKSSNTLFSNKTEQHAFIHDLGNTLFSNKIEQHAFIHDLGMQNLHFIDEKTQYCNFQVKKPVPSSAKSGFCILPDGLHMFPCLLLTVRIQHHSHNKMDTVAHGAGIAQSVEQLKSQGQYSRRFESLNND